MDKKVDIIYVVASKLGSIGMGTTAYNAIKKVESSKNITCKIFCRGYNKNLDLNLKNIKSYGYLETASLPLRFLEKILRLKINPFKYINYFFGELVYRNLPKCRIYHSWMGIAPKAADKAKKNGAIMILEGANSHPLNLLEILNKEYKKYRKKDLIIKKESLQKDVEMINQFDYIMCPSNFVYNSFLKQGFSKNQLIKMPYGVDINKFKIREKTDSIFRIIFVGSVQLRKGVHYLLQAWEELKLENSELIIVGRIWPDAADIIEKYKSNKTIKFIGFESNPKKFLEKSDVFVSPSLEEGSALTCYEAMACGLPVIATYNTGSILRDKKDGFEIPIRNINILKEKINYFYKNKKEIDKMGRSARKRVEKFSWDNYSKNIMNKYKDILKNEK